MKRRIPSLDGLRACAVFSVILLHIDQRYTGLPLWATALLRTFDGVGLFFVLSGFLITLLLLEEYQAKGTISLGDFYLRRTFRILPPFYTYLLLASLFAWLIHTPLHARSLLSAGLFFQNYDPASSTWLTEHTWSLSVEEQFYLLWPLTLLFVLRRWGRAGAVRVAIALIAITPVIRTLAHLVPSPILLHRESYLLFTRMDALMCGCLVALLAGTPRFERVFTQVSRVWWLLPTGFYTVSGLLTLAFANGYRNTLGMTFDSITMALFILWCARNEHTVMGRVLNWRPMVTAGVLSYSAYLWQTLFIHSENPTRASHMPWALVYAWVAAWLSYTLVEQPALRLRKRLERRSTLPLMEETEPAEVLR